MSTRVRKKRASTVLFGMVGPLTLGKLLRAIRLADGQTQDVFSRKLAISKQQLSDIENGRKSVSAKAAAKYADKLGYSRDQFIKLCLQDTLLRLGMRYSIEVMPIRSRQKSAG